MLEQTEWLSEETRNKAIEKLDSIGINAVLQQFEEFYETYDIKEGDGMYLAPEDRVAVW